MPLTSSFSLNPHLFNPTLYSRILTLWFSDLPLPASAPALSQVTRWFGLGANTATRTAFDSQCRSTVLDALYSIGPNNLTLPAFTDTETERNQYSSIAAPFVPQFSAHNGIEDSKIALALVLLLDQMPRNCFRDEQKLIYSHYDRISRALSHKIYARELDKSEVFRDSPPWRIWFYMPLMHSELGDDHELLGRVLEDMKARAEEGGDEKAIEYMGTVKGFEVMHNDVLRKFGRYPHRNRVLGRQSTGEEEEWLEAGGNTFGA